MEIDTLEARIKVLEAEVNEQARLLGESGSTEAKLNARIKELEAQELGFIHTLCTQSEEAKELRERIALLEGALTDALDNYEYYAQYAGEYLSKKHRVAEDIAEKRALLQEQVR
jgi:chromosome segregation ATPase